jgi:hypothetical protein
LAKETWVGDNIYTVLLFWLTASCALFNLIIKNLLFIKLALSTQPSAASQQKQLFAVCIAAATSASVIVLAFMVAAYSVHDPKLKDSLTAAWLGTCGITTTVFSFTYLKYGNAILKLLEKALDQSEEVREAFSRLKRIRNQSFVGSLIPGIVLSAFAAIPYLRSANIYFFCLMWTYFSLGNLVYIYNLRRSSSTSRNNSSASVGLHRTGSGISKKDYSKEESKESKEQTVANQP